MAPGAAPRDYPPHAIDRATSLRFWIFLALLAACVLGGGSASADVFSLLYLRPLAVLCLLAFLAMPERRRDEDPTRFLLLLLATFAATVAIQLLPLPHDLWASLPGHSRFALDADVVGEPLPWRPLSLAPHLTWNSLLALIPPLAALLGLRAMRQEQHEALLVVLIGVTLAGLLLALVQITGGSNSSAYLYDVTHADSGVGFFANRNHQAALLAMTFPMLRAWTLLDGGSPDWRRARAWIALAIGLFLLPMLLVTGSRAGLLLGMVGLVLAALIGVGHGGRSKRALGATRQWMLAGLGLAAVVGVTATMLLARRVVSVERLWTTDIGGDQRFRELPLVVEITGDFLPFGTGFGSFDPVYRSYEPDESLALQYFNNAHNDFLELVMTGGLAAAIVLLVFLVWYGRAAVRAFRPTRRSAPLLLGRVGVAMILIVGLSSAVDYPLRTPLLAVTFTIACVWLARASARASISALPSQGRHATPPPRHLS